MKSSIYFLSLMLALMCFSRIARATSREDMISMWAEFRYQSNDCDYDTLEIVLSTKTMDFKLQSQMSKLGNDPVCADVSGASFSLDCFKKVQDLAGGTFERAAADAGCKKDSTKYRKMIMGNVGDDSVSSVQKPASKEKAQGAAQ